MPTGADIKERVGDSSHDSNSNMTQEQSFKKGFCSLRHGLAFILQLCNFSIYTQQMNLSIAITAMVNTTAATSQPNASTDSQDFWNETVQESKAPVYDWTPEIQGILLSSLSYGSFLAPIPTGYVAGVFGAKYVVGAGLLISSVLTLFIPLAADTGVALLIVLRVIQGIAQVMVLTGQYSIWVKWAPPLERSQLTTIAGSGAMLGTFLVLIAGGLLCQTLGWPYIFYIFEIIQLKENASTVLTGSSITGGIGCACCLIWFPLVYDDPENHPFISTAEKRYIGCSLAHEDQSGPQWGMLRLLVLTISNFQSGILSALPFVFGCVFIILGGLLADFLLSRKILRLVTIRKLFTAIGVLVSSGILVPLPWVSSSRSTTMAFLVLSSVFCSLCDSGALINFLDIAPRYAGFLKGLLQIFSYIAGAVAPTAAGFFIGQDPELGWRNVFLLAAAIDVVGLLFYLVFGQAEVQDWAKEQTHL
ncbi:hypothetical protein ACRRTK_018235 [Alexandromys fortis]